MDAQGNITQPGELKEYKWDDTRGLRYAEIAVLDDERIAFYNSTRLSDAPPDVWDAVDAERVAQKYGLKSAFKNGPHWWVPDRLTLSLGADVVTMEGMGFRWASQFPAALIGGKAGGFDKLQAGLAYTVFEADKTGALGYDAGKLVYELVSPDGDAFAMQAANMEVDALADLGDRLDLPEGWAFRARTLDEDLTVDLDGKVKTTVDELRNVYNLVPNTTG